MIIKNALKGLYIGSIYGTVLLIFEDLLGIFVTWSEISLKQFVFSLIAYIVIFALLGLFAGIMMSIFRRQTAKFEFPLAGVLTVFTTFLWFYLGLKPVLLGKVFAFAGGHMMAMLVWALITALTAAAVKLIMSVFLKDLNWRHKAFISLNVSLAYFAVVYFKIYKNPEISDYLKAELPFWPVLVFFSALGIWLISTYILEKRDVSAGKSLSSKAKTHLTAGIALWLAVLILGFTAAVIDKDKKKSDETAAADNGSFNVILIICDALRADHLSLYGYDRKTSPNLEKLASEAVVFNSAYSMSSYTKMSMSALLTSRFAEMNGAFTWGGPGLPLDLTLLPEIMKENGYHTALFSANPFVTPEYQYTQGTDDFSHIQGRILKQLIFPGDIIIYKFPPLGELFYKLGLYDSECSLASAEMMNRRIFPWLEKNKDSRFFLYLHYMDSHMPIAPKEPIYSKGKYPNMFQMREARSTHDSQDTLEYSEGIKDISISRYDDSIIAFDKEIGRLFDKLQDLDLRKNTLIIFTSDHGEEYFDRGFTGHGHSLFNEVVYVPLVFFFPGQTYKGTRIPEPVDHLSIVPSVVDFSRIKGDYAFEGTSLIPLITGDTALFRQNSKPWFASVYPYEGTWKFKNIKAVMEGDFKYIRCYYRDKDGTEEYLFNTVADPMERNNLFSTRPEISAELSKMMDAYIAYSDSARALLSEDAPQKEISEEQKDRLKAIGYVQ